MNIWVSRILKLSISVGILYYIFSIIPFREVIASIKTVNLIYIVIAFSVVFVSLFIAALQMKLLTDRQGMTLSLGKIFQINLIARFYSIFLPGQLAAGVIRWHKLSRPDNKRAQAFASITFNRLVDTIIIVIVGILFWFDSVSDTDYKIGLVLISILFVLLSIYFLLFNVRGYKFLYGHKVKLNLIPIPLVFQGKIDKLLSSITRYHDLSQSLFASVVALSLTKRLLGILSFWLFALSLGIEISFINICWVSSIILILNMLPVSFSGLGVREGALIVLLQPYGISATDAVALSLLLFARAIMVGGIGGLIELKDLLLTSKGKSVIKGEISS